jgi:hypothetical protein
LHVLPGQLTFGLAIWPQIRTTPRAKVGAIGMESLRDRNRPGFRYHLKVHIFRTFTAILAWVLLVAVFYYQPELLASAQRLMQRGVEAVRDAVPSSLGARVELAFREIGGWIWLQITMVILAIRMVLSTIAATWRFTLGATGPSRPQLMSDPVALAVYSVLTFGFLGLLILTLQQ